jgi:2-polyprenyl-6-methoxyphenol hydroxylase-like FAD-dependent oxidoreductase
VTGLIPRGNGVGGVTLHDRGGSEGRFGSGQALEADFVVDATGRGSRTPEWLARLGYPAPRETQIDPLLGYASRRYAIPPGFDADWKAVYIQTDPPDVKRTGILCPLDNGRWQCTLAGAGRDYPPTEDEGYLDFAKSLRSPELYEMIRDAEPLTPIVGFRHTVNRRRHYDRLPAWPERFVVLGDAACIFNPLYAQGMSVVAFQAAALNEWLRSHASARVFQRRAARAAAGAWLIATSEDRRFAETVGPPARWWTRAVNWYVSRVVAAATVDERVCARLLDVFTLRSRPPALFLPPVLARVIAVTARSRPATPSAADPSITKVAG